MVKKRGIIRLIEASIAILIIIGVVLALFGRPQPADEVDLTKTIRPILEEISRNNVIREKIISGDPQGGQMARNLIDMRIQDSRLDHSFKICEIDELCSLDNYPSTVGDIYTSERILGSTLQTFGPKKIKIFLWRI